MTAQDCSTGHSHNATGRAAQYGIFAGEGKGIGQAPGRLHEHQAHTWHFTRHLIDVAPQNGRQVGIYHGGVTAADKLHQGAGFKRRANLGKAYFCRNAPGGPLVLNVPVAVHENDGGTAQPCVVLALQVNAQTWFVQSLHDFAKGTNPLLRLHHGAVQQLGQHNMPLKNFGPILVGNAQGIPKSLGRDQQGRLALALQQRVGGHRGPHLHAFNQNGGNGLMGFKTQQMPDTRHSGIFVLLRVFGQQLVGDQFTVWLLANDVSEGAAPVYPKLPAWGLFVLHGSKFQIQRLAADRAAWS